MNRVFAVASCRLISGLTGVLVMASAGAGSGCPSPTGDWGWNSGGVITFAENGVAGARPNRQAPALVTGTWRCRGNDSIEVKWSNGFTEILAFSPDTHKLSGHNQLGIEVGGSRLEIDRLERLFETTMVNGQKIPRGLPRLVFSVYQSQALPWRKDALPTWVRIERADADDFLITLHFYSPSSAKELRVRMTSGALVTRVTSGARSIHDPLPPDFVDLPQIVAAAYESGKGGRLKRADLRVHGNSGPAWKLSTDHPAGVTFSAVTGERIRGDITGYIAQYEAGWDRLHAQWQKVLDRYHPPEHDTGYTSPFIPKGIHRDRDSCTRGGGSWSNQGGYNNLGSCS